MLHTGWQAVVSFVCSLSALEAWQHQNLWWELLLVVALLLVSFWCALQYISELLIFFAFSCIVHLQWIFWNIGLTLVYIQAAHQIIEFIYMVIYITSMAGTWGVSGYMMMLPGVSLSYSYPWAGFHPNLRYTILVWRSFGLAVFFWTILSLLWHSRYLEYAHSILVIQFVFATVCIDSHCHLYIT